MLTVQQEKLLRHYILIDRILIPRLNDLGIRLFTIDEFSWLRICDLSGYCQGDTFKLYDIREPSTEVSLVVKDCVVVSCTKDTLVYQFTGNDQKFTLTEREFNDYLVKLIK